jgi:hypothetical protein
VFHEASVLGLDFHEVLCYRLLLIGIKGLDGGINLKLALGQHGEVQVSFNLSLLIEGPSYWGQAEDHGSLRIPSKGTP